MKRQLFAIGLFISLATSNIYSQTPEWKWGKSGIGNDYDLGYAAAADAAGNVIVVGYFNSDSITFENSTLHNTALGFSDVVIVKYDSSGNVLWAKGHGGNDDDRAYSVATDASGNIYVTGDFYSASITFGSYTLISTDATADFFVVKYDPTGNVVWAKKEGGIGVDIPYDIAVDAPGNTIVVGRFSSSQIIFGSDTLIMMGSMDAFIVKYTPSGNVAWATSAGSGSNDEAYSVEADESGNVYVSGYFNQTATFNTISLTSEGQSDIFLAKYDSSGEVQWVRGVGGNGDDRAQAISIDNSGNIYEAGFYNNDTIMFGSVTLPQESGQNSFIAKYTQDGNAVWAKALHGDSKAYGLVVTDDGVFACGSFSDDTLSYDGITLFLQGSSDFYLLKLDASGNTDWLRKQTDGGESSEVAYSVAADPWGNIFMTGHFGSHESVTFGSDVLEPFDNSYDIFTARLGNSSVGIEDLQSDNKISVYPNPSNGKFILKSEQAFTTIEVYDITGSKIYTSPSYHSEIDVSSLSEGIYFLKWYDGENHFCRKIIIQKN